MIRRRAKTAPSLPPANPGPDEADMAPPVSREALAAWLVGKRWFAGAEPTPPAKVDRAIDRPAAVTPLGVSVTMLPLPIEPPLAVGLVDTDRGDRYQLLLDPHLDGHPDVGDDPAAAAALARWITTAGRSRPNPAGQIIGHWPDGPALGPGTDRTLGGEQSNTSAVIGGTHVLKIFRRLQPGIHPEIEVGRHLARVAAAGRSAPVARLDGWYELVPPTGSVEPTALGVVQALVPGALDAWGLVLSALAGHPGALLESLHHLGGALAQLHGALAEQSDTEGTDPDRPAAFGVVALTPSRVAEMVAGVAADATRLLATTTDRPALAGIVGRADDVTDLANRLMARLGTDLGTAIRHHGDLHLGQVVLGDHGWVFLDFEGEPTRPLAARRRRHSPLRDVAGMLRSLAYAAATHRRAAPNHLGAGWEPAARAAFLDGYLAAVEPRLLPASAFATHTLLTLLELEKVIYEIDYELAHRPDWVGLPVQGLRNLLDGPSS